METKHNIFWLCLAITIIYVVAKKNGELDACVELFNPEKMQSKCCLTIHKVMNAKADECFKEKDTCAKAKCMLEKDDVLSGDEIDEAKFLKLLQMADDNNEEEKTMASRIEDKCLNGQYKEYGPDNLCDYIKFVVCGYLHANISCKTWKDGDVCTKMNKSAEKCQKQIDAAMK